MPSSASTTEPTSGMPEFERMKERMKGKKGSNTFNAEDAISEGSQYKFKLVPLPEELVLPPLQWKGLLCAIQSAKNILFVGPSGTGKTWASKKAAEALGRPYFIFNLGDTQDARTALIGTTHFVHGKGTVFQPSMFIEAIQTPNAVVNLDELTRGNHDAWNILLPVLESHQRILRINESDGTGVDKVVKVADGVSFIATANVGTNYTATRQLDRALQDRFQLIIEMPFMSKAHEYKFLSSRFPSVKSEVVHCFTAVAEHVRQSYINDTSDINEYISTRVLLEMMDLNSQGFTPLECFEMLVYPFYEQGIERDSVKAVVNEKLPKDGNLKQPFNKPVQGIEA